MAARSRPPEDLTAQAYRTLRQIIVDGRMSPQQRLSHRSLSKDLGIGRSPVRDALLQLEAEGLIEHRPSSGIYLREISPRELEQIYELRMVNEPFAAERAATFADAGHVARLRRVCDQLTVIASKPDPQRWFANVEHRRDFCRLDMEFHAAVLEASGNPLLAKLLSNAQILAMTFAWDLGHGGPEWFAAIVVETCTWHRAIYNAIRAHDPAAARQAMEGHIRWAKSEIPEHYAADQERAGRAT
ncbi:MAG: GntR family transcriptional regulator [Planctomycetaceae bacterium]